MWGSRTAQVMFRAGVALAFAAGCGSGSTGFTAANLADYAEGHWSCDLPVPGAPEQPHLKPDADVTVVGPSGGRVMVEFPWLAGLHALLPDGPEVEPTGIAGQWSLRAGELSVKWDDGDLGTLEAKPIALDTTQFEIKSGDPKDAQWVPVKVDRRDRSVKFDFPIFPGSGSAQLTCRKG